MNPGERSIRPVEATPTTPADARSHDAMTNSNPTLVADHVALTISLDAPGIRTALDALAPYDAAIEVAELKRTASAAADRLDRPNRIDA